MTLTNWPRVISPWVRCPACGVPIAFAQEQLAGYFESLPLICPSCQSSHDWWSVASQEIEDNLMHNQAFVLVGAVTGIFQLLLKPGERLTYRFTDYGVPGDAKILYVSYTPNGGNLFPAEIHGNVPPRRLMSKEITASRGAIHGRSVSSWTLKSMSWLAGCHHPRTTSLSKVLLTAFEAYASGHTSPDGSCQPT